MVNVLQGWYPSYWEYFGCMLITTSGIDSPVTWSFFPFDPLNPPMKRGISNKKEPASPGPGSRPVLPDDLDPAFSLLASSLLHELL